MAFLRLSLLALVLAAWLPAARCDEDEPTSYGKPLSSWLQMLQEDKNANHRQAAVIAVQLIGPKKSRKVIPALITALRSDGDMQVRVRAANALRDIVDQTLQAKNTDFPLHSIRDAFAAALRSDKEGPVREAAARGLGTFKGEAVAAVGTLALALKDRHSGTRAAAADTLRRMGKEGVEALPEIQQVLRDKTVDRLTRAQCALAIGRIGAPEALPALPALREVLEDSACNTEVRKAAAETLGQLGKDAAEAASSLGSVLGARDTSVTLRRAAVNALDAMGAEAGPALAALEGALKDDDQFVRSAALHTLGQLGQSLNARRKTVIHAMLACMDDSSIEVRLSAIGALATLGREGLGEEAPAVEQRLSDASHDSEKVIREAAGQALKKLKGKS